MSHRLSLFPALCLLAACGSEPAPAEEAPPAAHPAAPSAAVAMADSNAPLPGGFTPYPGAQEVSRTSIKQDGQSYTLLSLQSAAAPELLVAFYREQAEAAEIPISLEVSANGLHQIGGETPAGLNFSFTASGAGGQTSATLAIGQSAPGQSLSE